MAALTDETVSRYWNWAHSLKKDHFPPKQGEGLIDNSDPSEVFLMDTADVSNKVGPLNLDCSHTPITTKQGKQVLVPLWIGWCDSTEFPNRLADHAQEVYNLGHIQSTVKVDDKPFANLDVTMSKVGNTVKETYSSNGQLNVIEHSTENDFELTTPTESIKLLCPTAVAVKEGTRRAGGHGWWTKVILESGSHKISYNTTVDTKGLPPGSETSRGTPFTSAVITYSLKVE